MLADKGQVFRIEEGNTMKNRKKAYIISGALLAAGLFAVGQTSYGSGFEPGSNEDPLVTLSYVENKIDELSSNINDSLMSMQNEINNIETQPGNPSGEETQGSQMQVVELDGGQTLIAGEGTEIIVRAGQVTAIDSEMGGLSDVTAAKDISEGEEIPTNHLIIVPRDDGRGLTALSEKVYLMVRGGYEVK